MLHQEIKQAVQNQPLKHTQALSCGPATVVSRPTRKGQVPGARLFVLRSVSWGQSQRGGLNDEVFVLSTADPRPRHGPL